MRKRTRKALIDRAAHRFAKLEAGGSGDFDALAAGFEAGYRAAIRHARRHARKDARMFGDDMPAGFLGNWLGPDT